MPNRVLKDSIKRSDEIAALSWFEEVTYTRLMLTADDFGCVDARPSVLKSDLFPLKDEMPLSELLDAIRHLQALGLVGSYEVDGRPYLYLTEWEQRLRRRTRKFPAPPCQTDDGQVTADCAPETETEIETETESETEKETELRDAHDLFFDFANGNEALLLALRDYEAMRKELGKPLTKRGRQLLLQTLRKISADPGILVQVLEQSVRNSWTGVFPVKQTAASGALQVASADAPGALEFAMVRRLNTG